MKPHAKLMVATAALAMALTLAWALPADAAAPNPTPADLDVPLGYTEVLVRATNAVGQVVGFGESFDEGEVPCIWEPTAEGWSLTVLPLPTGAEEAAALGINDLGIVVGSCRITEGNHIVVCEWEKVEGGWTVATLALPEGYDGAESYDINNQGQVFGQVWVAESGQSDLCIWDNGVANILAFDGISFNSFGDQARINELGQVLARAGDSENLYVCDTTGATHIADECSGPSMNNFGEIAGMYGSGEDDKNFVYLPEAAYGLSAGLHDMGLFADVGYSFKGINDSGQILVIGMTQYDDVYNGTTGVSILQLGEAAPVLLGSVPGTLWARFLNGAGEASGNWYNWPDVGSATAGAFYASADDGVVELNGLMTGGQFQVIDMSDSGVIAGQAYTESGQHACVWGSPTVEAESALDITDITLMPRNPKVITVCVQIGNPNDETAYDVTVIAASLNGSDTNSRLPLVYGAIKAGDSKKCTLQFKDVPSGDQTLTVNGTSSLGDFFIEQTVAVP